MPLTTRHGTEPRIYGDGMHEKKNINDLNLGVLNGRISGKVSVLYKNKINFREFWLISGRLLYVQVM